jgi:hypothetical protein
LVKTATKLVLGKKHENRSPFKAAFVDSMKNKYVRINEYPIYQALKSLVEMEMLMSAERGVSRTPLRIFDPSAGWGNRVYAGAALLQLGRCAYFYGSDPNMLNNGIAEYLQAQIDNNLIENVNLGEFEIGPTETAHLEDFTGNTVSYEVPSRQRKTTGNLTLDSEKIGQNLEIARNSSDTTLRQQFNLIHSCPPYNNPSNPKAHSGTQEVDVQTESYQDCSYSNNGFYEEFGVNLAFLSVYALEEQGYVLIQFNRDHARDFAALLHATGMFDNITLSSAVIDSGSRQDAPQQYVRAKRNAVPLGQFSEARFKAFSAGGIEVGYYTNLVNGGDITVCSPKTVNEYKKEGVLFP